MSFKFVVSDSSKLPEVKIIQPSLFEDFRGTMWTSFLDRELSYLLPKGLNFIHDKFSETKKNVLRGIHGDNKTWKLVTSVYGDIFQVVVDCRKDSETYSLWESFILSNKSPNLILIPPGFGNAFYVQSETAIYHYKLAYEEDYNDAENQFTFSWDDSEFNIQWPSSKPILSERDSSTSG